MADGGDLLEVGYVCGAHGVRGALLVQLHDPESRLVDAGSRLALCPREQSSSSRRWLEVLEASAVPGQAGRWRVQFEGVRDRNEAEALKGFQLKVDRESLPPLPEDEYYLTDAIGRPVLHRRDSGDPMEVGTIVGLMSNGAQDLFEVEWETPEGRTERWLFPALPGFVLDVTADRVLVDLPLGMLPEQLEAQR